MCRFPRKCNESGSAIQKGRIGTLLYIVSTPNTRMNPFTIIVQVPPPANTTSPTTLTSCILCGAIRPANDFIWPFTGISLNEDGLFNTHSPDMQMMELAILNAMESIATWAGGKKISARDIQQNKPLVQIDDNNKNTTIEELRQAP